MEIKEGDVIKYRAFGGEVRTVKVEFVSDDIKNGRAGFDGVLVSDDTYGVWGYLDQIISKVR